MINHDEKTSSDKVQDIRTIADSHLIEKDGKWMLIGFDNKMASAQDLNKTFATRQEAVDAAVNLIRSNKLTAA